MALWLFTDIGFFSVIKPEDPKFNGQLCVRARVEEDLDNLRDLYLPRLGPTIKTPSRDYLWRAYCTQSDYAEAVKLVAESIDYSNFKSSVVDPEHVRGSFYLRVWSAMCELQDKVHPQPRPIPVKAIPHGRKQLNLDNYISSNFEIVPGGKGYREVRKKRIQEQHKKGKRR